MPHNGSFVGAAQDIGSRVGHAAGALVIAGTTYANVTMTQPEVQLDPEDGTPQVTMLVEDPTTPASLVMESGLHDMVGAYSDAEKRGEESMDQVEELADSFRFDELTPAEHRDVEDMFAPDEAPEAGAAVGLFEGVAEAPEMGPGGGEGGGLL